MCKKSEKFFYEHRRALRKKYAEWEVRNEKTREICVNIYFFCLLYFHAWGAFIDLQHFLWKKLILFISSPLSYFILPWTHLKWNRMNRKRYHFSLKARIFKSILYWTGVAQSHFLKMCLNYEVIFTNRKNFEFLKKKI